MKNSTEMEYGFESQDGSITPEDKPESKLAGYPISELIAMGILVKDSGGIYSDSKGKKDVERAERYSF